MQYTVQKMAENEKKMRQLGIRDAGDLDIEHDGLVDDDESKGATLDSHKEALVEKKETKSEAPKEIQAQKEPTHQSRKSKADDPGLSIEISSLEDIPDLDEHIHAKAKAEKPREERTERVEHVQKTAGRRKHADDSDFSIETSRLEDIDAPVQAAEKKAEAPKKEPAKLQLKEAMVNAV